MHAPHPPTPFSLLPSPVWSFIAFMTRSGRSFLVSFLMSFPMSFLMLLLLLFLFLFDGRSS